MFLYKVLCLPLVRCQHCQLPLVVELDCDVVRVVVLHVQDQLVHVSLLDLEQDSVIGLGIGHGAEVGGGLHAVGLLVGGGGLGRRRGRRGHGVVGRTANVAACKNAKEFDDISDMRNCSFFVLYLHC